MLYSTVGNFHIFVNFFLNITKRNNTSSSNTEQISNSDILTNNSFYPAIPLGRGIYTSVFGAQNNISFNSLDYYSEIIFPTISSTTSKIGQIIGGDYYSNIIYLPDLYIVNYTRKTKSLLRPSSKNSTSESIKLITPIDVFPNDKVGIFLQNSNSIPDDNDLLIECSLFVKYN